MKSSFRYLKYGVSDKLWDEMSKYGCEICGRTTGRLCIDHIHVKNYKKMLPNDKIKYVRGALCFICNVGLRGFEKTIDGNRNRKQLENTYKYFKKYKLKGEI